MNSFQGGSEDIDAHYLQQMSNARIDFLKRKVTQFQTKRYKFEAMLPFEVSKHVILRNNRYILQVKVTNASINKVFPDHIQFLVGNPKTYKLVDINDNLQEKSVTFCPEEIRSFIFILEPKDPINYKINKFQDEILGQMELKWFNIFGDAGFMKVGPFKYSYEMQTKLQVEIK